MEFTNTEGLKTVEKIIRTIQQNKDYLSRIDGEIGDGDHGINMNKGFTMAKEEIVKRELDMSGAFILLGKTLLMRIGGSMGPLYGTIFQEMGKAAKDVETIDKNTVGAMLAGALAGVRRISPAQPGDKTLMDVLCPAVEAYEAEIQSGSELDAALLKMKAAAEAGKEATKDMVAKLGRSSRLGERSRGVLDAGAASCNLILQSFADSIIELVK